MTLTEKLKLGAIFGIGVFLEGVLLTVAACEHVLEKLSPEDADCQRCDGTGCVACDARFLDAAAYN